MLSINFCFELGLSYDSFYRDGKAPVVILKGAVLAFQLHNLQYWLLAQSVGPRPRVVGVVTHLQLIVTGFYYQKLNTKKKY